MILSSKEALKLLDEAVKLKKEIDEILNCNVYSLFPEIIDNIMN